MPEKFAVTRYQDGLIVGHIELTPEQFAHFNAIAQQPQGIARIGDLPHDLYAFDPQYQDLGADTVIYLD